MKVIKTISESDFGRALDSDHQQKYAIRRAARAILLNKDSQIALMHVSSDNYYKLPGGGIDEGESIDNALKRELFEEVGAREIDVILELGRVDSYLDQVRTKSEHVCFVAKTLKPTVEPSRTEKEVAEGYNTVWVDSIDEAIKLVESGTPSEYGHDFERLRELAFLEYYKNSKLVH
jgi:8-oxo-dGTP pyrophosphatase MutT (NUDIX family)